MRPNGPNHVWAVDFVHDKLSNNRPYKMLTVVDEYTRQALAVHVAHKMSAADVLEALYPLLITHGAPHHIRSDNGPEFTAEVFPKVAYQGRYKTNSYLPRFAMGKWL